MIANRCPGPKAAGLKIAVLEEVRTRPRDRSENKGNVVDVKVADAVHVDGEVIRPRADTRGGCAAKETPTRPVRPVADAGVVLGGINELERGADATGCRGPGGNRFIANRVDDLVQIGRCARFDEGNLLAVRIEVAVEFAQHGYGRAKGGPKGGAVLGDNQELFVADD